MAVNIIKPFIFLADFLFPSECINCRSPVSVIDNYLCNPCFNAIPVLENRCETCSGEIIDGKCIICSDREFYVSRNICITKYSGIIKNILHCYKFNKRRRLYIHLVNLAFNGIKDFADPIDIITTIPMSRIKKWERGFNQSELIAKGLSRRLDKSYFHLLREKSRYKTQRMLGFRERFINILDRYTVRNAEKIKGRNILLIDDVFTTGATINECARILKSFNAKNVYSLTIARVDIKRVE